MELLVFTMSNPIRWGLEKDTPDTFDLANYNGWKLVNPLHYRQILCEDLAKEETPTIIGLYNDKYIVLSKQLILLTDVTKDNFREKFFVVDDILLDLVAQLRFCCKQFTINNTQWKSCSLKSIDGFMELPNPSAGETCSMPAWALDTSITSEDLAYLNTLHDGIPPFDAVLLDGMEALHRLDTTTAILLAAVAVESAIRSKLSQLLIVSTNTTNNPCFSLTISDDLEPKSEYLTKCLIRDRKIDDLIKSTTYLLMNKSLNSEDHSLYNKVLGLFRERNSMAHSATHPLESRNKRYLLRHAIEMLRVAVDCIAWYGYRNRYSIPFEGIAIFNNVLE